MFVPPDAPLQDSVTFPSATVWLTEQAVGAPAAVVAAPMLSSVQVPVLDCDASGCTGRGWYASADRKFCWSQGGGGIGCTHGSLAKHGLRSTGCESGSDSPDKNRASWVCRAWITPPLGCRADGAEIADFRGVHYYISFFLSSILFWRLEDKGCGSPFTPRNTQTVGKNSVLKSAQSRAESAPPSAEKTARYCRGGS